MIFLLGLLTWLTAFIWPFVLLARIARGLWELIPQLLDGSVTGFAGSFWESFNLENFSGTNAAAFSAWNTANEIFKAVGGLFNFILGMFLVLVVLILMLSLLVALRKNIGAARGYMVANLILCALGNLLSYSVIKRMSDTIEVLQPPYHNIPTLALIMTAVVALLWIISILYYTSLVAKSKKLA
ncbi:MAG: hypothetical protein LBC96_06380 [Lachnospiraceae bacterium]|nr:hypothetical protein [Lachnospiraceae bacterium]